MEKPTISKEEMRRLIATNHVVSVYPRKKIVCVDWFKYYKLPKNYKKEVYKCHDCGWTSLNPYEGYCSRCGYVLVKE